MNEENELIDKINFEYSLCGIYTFPKNLAYDVKMEESQSDESKEGDNEFLELLTTLKQGSDSSTAFAWERRIYVKTQKSNDSNLDMTASKSSYSTIHIRIFTKPDNLKGMCSVSQYSSSDKTSPHKGVTKKEIVSDRAIIKVLESYGYRLFAKMFETGQLFIFYSDKKEEVFVYVTKQNSRHFEEYSITDDKLLIKVKGSTIGKRSNDALYHKVHKVATSIKKFVTLEVVPENILETRNWDETT